MNTHTQNNQAEQVKGGRRKRQREWVWVCGYAATSVARNVSHEATDGRHRMPQPSATSRCRPCVCVCVCVCEAKEKKKKSQGTTVAAGVGCAEGEQNLVTSACSSVARFSPGLIALEPVLFFFFCFCWRCMFICIVYLMFPPPPC